ncbi:MAG: co-chaperone GroES [Chloroflexi bacterium]|nr:MAG: co-chaperone GroES [Chloroflexota bacterium]MBL1195128.1 co-chaperone GroES [Chloroflexota bacterium]NOH12413.1 co-chaperone GroES [Chloroflexota bacterium]
MKLKPLGSQVVIQPIEEDEVSPGGIVLPESAKEKPQKGKILAVGPGGRDKSGERIAMEVETGQTVLFAKYAGTEVKLNGQHHLIMKEEEILAILDALEKPASKKSPKSRKSKSKAKVK